MMTIAYSEKNGYYFFPFGKNKYKPFQYVKSNYLRWALEQCERDGNSYAADKIKQELNKRANGQVSKSPPKPKVSIRSESRKIETAMLYGVANPQRMAVEMKRLKEQRRYNEPLIEKKDEVFDTDFDLVNNDY